jgi:PKD repeat protein
MRSLRTTTGILVALVVLFPAVAPAQTVTASSGASVGIQQLTALYTQLIQLLEQEIAQLTAAMQSGGGIATTTPSLWQQGTSTHPVWQQRIASSTAAYSFTASPASGTAPLAVSFTAIATGTPETEEWYAVDFGDGTTGDMSEDASNNLSLSHTYAAGGTFTARLLQDQNLCGAVGTYNYGCTRQLQVGSVTIAVSGPTNSPTPVVSGCPAATSPDSAGGCVTTTANTTTTTTSDSNSSTLTGNSTYSQLWPLEQILAATSTSQGIQTTRIVSAPTPSCTTSDGITVQSGYSLIPADQGLGGYAMSSYYKCMNGQWLSMGITPVSAPEAGTGYTVTVYP